MIDKKRRLFLFLLGMMAVISLCAESQPDGSWVIIPNQGRWQMFSLPQAWMDRHGKPAGAQNAYIALIPPHLDDVFEPLSPCSPSQELCLFPSIKITT